jgi:hypothetical protein
MTDDERGTLGGMTISRGEQRTQRKSAPGPLYVPQPHDLSRARTRAAEVGNQRLTA